MKIAVTLASACLALGQVGAVAIESHSSDNNPRVLKLDMERHQVQNPVLHDRARLRRRKDPVEVTLDNLQTLYFFNATLGTPPQKVRLHLDTGSSDLWVNTKSSQFCKVESQICSASGTYTANSSSTYQYLNSYFNISYVDGSSAAGDYVQDTISLSNMKIDDFQFGIGYSSSSAQGVLGIGYPANEAQVIRANKKPYENLPARMFADKLVESNTYSIWLNDAASKTGSLLFGGIDKAQYTGDLVTVPIEKVGGEFREFFITMTGIDVESTQLQKDMALAVLLDTGSSLSYLPNDIVQDLYQKLNATYIEQDQAAFVRCDAPNQPKEVTFHFSKPASITVKTEEMILNITDGSGKPITYRDGSQACLLGISPGGTGTMVLGDTFLRSAYVVYDMDNNEISLAQSNFEAKGSDVVEVSKSNKISSIATKAESPVSAQSGLPPGSGNNSSGSEGAPRRSSMFCITATLFATLFFW